MVQIPRDLAEIAMSKVTGADFETYVNGVLSSLCLAQHTCRSVACMMVVLTATC